MVKRLGFRGTLPVKYKIDFWNNPITASIFGLKPSSFEPKPTTWLSQLQTNAKLGLSL